MQKVAVRTSQGNIGLKSNAVAEELRSPPSRHYSHSKILLANVHTSTERLILYNEFAPIMINILILHCFYHHHFMSQIHDSTHSIQFLIHV